MGTAVLIAIREIKEAVQEVVAFYIIMKHHRLIFAFPVFRTGLHDKRSLNPRVKTDNPAQKLGCYGIKSRILGDFSGIGIKLLALVQNHQDRLLAIS